MSSLRYNNLYGTLGATLASGATAITFNSALTHDNGVAVPTLAGGDTIELSIEPLTSNFEIVTLTAYTSGATTGTVTRTIAVSHSAGSSFVSAPTTTESMVFGLAAATVATSQTTSSATYADLATTGPAVTVVTNTTVILIVGASEMSNATAGDGCAMSAAVSGATTLAASDANAAFMTSAAGTQLYGSSMVSFLTGLTAGANTFTAKYKITFGGTATFVNRNIAVIPLPT